MDSEMENEKKSNNEVTISSTIDATDVIITEETSIAPVIIEELDEHAISSMKVDMAEFVEARALEVQEITEAIVPNYMYSPHSYSGSEVAADTEDQNILLLPEDEDRLTKQFLNGELTFSEYSSKMDQSIDLETTETDFSKKDAESDDINSQKTSKRKKTKLLGFSQCRQKKKRRTLPPVLQGLMGEANLRFARGEIELAAQICMEIIRQVPSAPEPFHTLAMIYESDQPEKSLQFALIAAHLSPKDADQWIRLANLSVESGNVKQAITCYSKAIQASPKDTTLYERRAQLQEQNGDRKAYLKGYTKLVHQLETEDGENIVKYAKILAKRYMQDNNNEQALEAMENIFSKCPSLITLEEVNIITEILISLKQFKRCLDILTKYTNIWVEYKTRLTDDANLDSVNNAKNAEGSDNCEAEAKDKLESSDTYVIESCDIPDDVVVDLKAKFLVTLIELNEIKIAESLLPKLHSKENPEISGDLFLDIAEALMGKKQFQHALVLLEPLVNSKNFSLAAVWLRHAECWVGCKNLNNAIKSYEIVRTLSPQHLGARLALAKLYKFKGRYNKAIEVLKQDPESDALDPDVIYQRTLLLLKVKRYNEYFQSGMLLLSRHCVTIRTKGELNTLARATGVRQRLEALQLHRLSCGEQLVDENAPIFINSEEPTEQNEFMLLLQMCKLAYKLGKYGLLQRICFSALTSKKFEDRSSHLMFLSLIACIHNNDSFYGYNIVRDLVRDCLNANYWNLLNIIIQRAEDSRHNRFIMRFLAKEDFSYLHIMHANNCLVSGSYKYALNDYMALFRVTPSALLALLIAVTMVQMACQRSSTKKNQLVIQAIAFLQKYSQLRGEGGEQETNYNMARAFHQLGLFPGAVHFYKKVLDMELEDIVLQNSKLFDLRKEAAFNLHLIYLHSENFLLAQMYLDKYITV